MNIWPEHLKQLSMPDLAVACTLTDAELRDRRSGLLAQLTRAAQERTELPDGFGFRFDPSGATLSLLAQVIDLERQCCAFLRFQLTIEPAQGPVWLQITGPEGTKEFLSDLLA